MTKQDEERKYDSLKMARPPAFYEKYCELPCTKTFFKLQELALNQFQGVSDDGNVHEFRKL